MQHTYNQCCSQESWEQSIKYRYKNMGKSKRVYIGSTTSTTELGEKPAKNEKGIGKFTNSDGSDRGNVLKRKEHTNVMKKEMAK